MPTTPHHQRRKSGSSSAADLRQYSTKTVTVSDMSRPRRPGLSRRQTPVSAHKLGKSARERERDRLDAWDDDRESFPQFCMTCEKQLAPVHNHGIYCSESCRRSDQASSAAQMPRSYTTAAYRPQHHGASSSHSNRHSYFGTSPTNYLYASDDDTYYASDDGDDASYPSRRADIIPQASPTMLASSPPMTPGTTSSAMEALRASLSMATRPPSPPSPLGSWSLTGGAPSAAGGGSYTASSYSRPSSTYRLSTTYDAPPGAGYHTGSPERPLPSRYPGYGSRPKSIELVTPMLR